MPISVTQTGPVIDPTTGKPVYIVVEVLNRTNQVQTDPTPSKSETKLTPPDCYEYKEWDRRLLTIENSLVHKFAADKKTNWTAIGGGILLVVGVIALTGGVGAVAYGVFWAASGTGVAIAGVGAGLTAAGVGGTGWGATLVKNPDDYEPGAEIGAPVSISTQVPPVLPMTPATEKKVIPCPNRVETGSGH
jgi:hypothetical protein